MNLVLENCIQESSGEKLITMLFVLLLLNTQIDQCAITARCVKTLPTPLYQHEEIHAILQVNLIQF